MTACSPSATVAGCQYTSNGSTEGKENSTAAAIYSATSSARANTACSLQDDGGRYGERRAEDPGLFHPEFPVQRRFAGRLPVPDLLHLDRHRQHRPERRGARLGDLELLLRRRHPHPLRTLYLYQGKGDGPEGIC